MRRHRDFSLLASFVVVVRLEHSALRQRMQRRPGAAPRTALALALALAVAGCQCAPLRGFLLVFCFLFCFVLFCFVFPFFLLFADAPPQIPSTRVSCAAATLQRFSANQIRRVTYLRCSIIDLSVSISLYLSPTFFLFLSLLPFSPKRGREERRSAQDNLLAQQRPRPLARHSLWWYGKLLHNLVAPRAKVVRIPCTEIDLSERGAWRGNSSQTHTALIASLPRRRLCARSRRRSKIFLQTALSVICGSLPFRCYFSL